MWVKLRAVPIGFALCWIAALACGDVSGSSTSVLSIQFDSLAAPSVVVGDTLRDTTGVVIVPVVHAFNFQGNEMKLLYKGKISGDTIKLSVDFAGNGAVEYTLKRAS